jgi:hypothetical protein
MKMAIVIGIILALIFGVIYFFISAPNRMLKIIRKKTEMTVNKVVNLSGKDCNDSEKLFSVMCKVLDFDEDTISDNILKYMKKFSTCIEGVCYNILLNVILHQVRTSFRCAQCIGMVNDYLENLGVDPCSIAMRESMLKDLDLYKLYKQYPDLFKFREPKKLKYALNTQIKANNNFDNHKLLQNSSNVKNINPQDKSIYIKARMTHPVKKIDVIRIYNELLSVPDLSFEIIWNKYSNINCDYDLTLYENIVEVGQHTYRHNALYITDNKNIMSMGQHYLESSIEQRGYFIHFYSRQDLALEYFFFQASLDYYSKAFTYTEYNLYTVITKNDKVITYKKLLQNYKQDKYFDFINGEYPFVYNKNRIQYIQVFIEKNFGEILIIDACITQKTYYTITEEFVVKKGLEILF